VLWVQGVEAVLTILQECYGWSYPGGLFLAAVDLLLEKEPVVRAVKQQLQRCMRKQPSAPARHSAYLLCPFYIITSSKQQRNACR
jgi:hypothetical protein